MDPREDREMIGGYSTGSVSELSRSNVQAQVEALRTSHDRKLRRLYQILQGLDATPRVVAEVADIIEGILNKSIRDSLYR